MRGETISRVPFPPDYRASGLLLHVTSLPSPYGIGDLGPVAISWFWWFTAFFECIGSMLTSFEDGVSRHLGSPWYPFRSRVLRQNYERFQSTPGTHQQQVNLNVAMLARAKEPMEETRPKAQKVEHERNSKQNASLRKSRKLLISETQGILPSDNPAKGQATARRRHAGRRSSPSGCGEGRRAQGRREGPLRVSQPAS